MKKVIGIIRCKKKIANSKVLYELLIRAGYLVSVTSFKDINKEYVKRSKTDTEILILEVDIDDIGEIDIGDFKLDVIIDVDMTLDKDEQEECLSKKISLINNLEQKDLLVVNVDNSNAIKLTSSNDKPVLMTYGLNSKSSVTVSSLNFDDNRTKFNLCLQRKLTTVNGNEVGQFEYPVDMSLMSMESLYIMIAFISTSLYLDVDIEDIVETLFTIN